VRDGRIFPRRFIFRLDITAVYGEPSFRINADEDAGSGDVDGIIDLTPLRGRPSHCFRSRRRSDVGSEAEQIIRGLTRL